MVKKYDIVLVNLQPTKGAEKRGIRPCVVVQNNPVNESQLQTVTVAPITSQIRKFLSMQFVVHSSENGLKVDSCIDLSQLRTVDKGRIRKLIGELESQYWSAVNEKITNFLDLRNEYI